NGRQRVFDPVIEFGIQEFATLFGALALGDVNVDANHGTRTPIPTISNQGSCFDPPHFTRWSDNSQLSNKLWLAFFEGTATFGRQPLQIVWMHALTPVIGSNFGGAQRQAQDCCAGLGQLHGSCNIVVGISANTGSLLSEAELCIALGEPKLGLLAISDISADANDPLRMSVAVICNEAA